MPITAEGATCVEGPSSHTHLWVCELNY